MFNVPLKNVTARGTIRLLPQTGRYGKPCAVFMRNVMILNEKNVLFLSVMFH